MGDIATSGISPAASIEGSSVLLIDQSGRILKILERGPFGPPPTLAATAAESKALDDVWPRDAANIICATARRALRARRSFSEKLRLEAGSCECLCVPQGRDSVLLLLRPQSTGAADISQIRRLAYEDAVTGLPNRQKLLAELQRVIDRQALREGRAAVLCMHFGDMDHYGHALSSHQQDEALRQIAARLAAQIRGSNEPLDPDMERVTIVARSDYRQFAVVLPAIETGQDAEAVAGRIIGALSEPIDIGDRTVWVSANIGVSLFPQDGSDAASLLENAQVAMEDSRHANAPGFRMHSGTMQLRSLQRQDLHCELKSAMQRDEFELHFLPIVESRSGSPVAMEALLRWPDSLIDGASVEKIVAVAERTGLIIEIGSWVFRTALEQLARWRAAGNTALRLAVNLSGQEFSRRDLCSRLEGWLAEAGASADALDIEINEHMLLRDAAAGLRRVDALKALGAKVIVDDFGRGPLSLAELAQSNVDGLKIDRTLIDNLVFSKPHRAACTAAIAIGESLGLAVTAEGVESEEQALILRQSGCALMQGFLFSRPLSARDVSDYLAITGRFRSDELGDL